MKSTSVLQVMGLVFGVFGAACGGTSNDTTGASESNLTNDLEPLPVMHGDPSWLACDDGTLALNVFEHRSSTGASRVTDATMFLGNNIVSGKISSTGRTRLSGGGSSFSGTSTIDFEANTVAVKGSLDLEGTTFAIDKKLSCKSLGLDFPKAGPAVSPPSVQHGDSQWLFCNSQRLVGNMLEHRNAAGDGRETSFTLVAGGKVRVAGNIEDDGAVHLVSKDGTASSFEGTATVDGLSIALEGVLSLDGTSFSVDDTIACSQLYSNL